MKKIIMSLVCLLALGHPVLRAQCNPQVSWAAVPVGNNLLNVSFSNTTAYTTPPGSYAQFSLLFGDGTSQPYLYGSSSHNYPAPGTYNAQLRMRIVDSMTAATSCADTLFFQVTVDYSPCATSFSYVNNGGGSYTFTANTPAGTSSMGYSWNFGDGTTGSGSPVTHTYTTPGLYTVNLQAAGGGCTYLNSTIFQYTNNTPCDSLYASFTASNLSADSVAFTNTSTIYPGTTQSFFWSFGDGNTSTLQDPVHAYPGPGTYTVTLYNTWSTPAQPVYCSDSVTQTVTVGNVSQPNLISGYIYWDSLSAAPDTFKVWLIVHDSIANTLTAVDSAWVNPFYPLYTFYNHPSGLYRVKAAVPGQTVSSTGWVPTYHFSSLYWNSASVIFHAGGSTTGKNILMQNGTVTAGPGFIGGNISLGAGKGTATGVPDMLVFLRKSNNQMVAATYTNADGDYTFSNIPEGTYNVYPEAMNYTTTPSATITISAGNTNSSNNNFEQTDDEILPMSGGLGISTLSKEDGIFVYPNPVSNTLFLESKNNNFSQVTIVNTQGQAVRQQAIRSGKNSIETADLGSGIYYLLIKGSGGARSLKISKK
jgi:PKD repeat protein